MFDSMRNDMCDSPHGKYCFLSHPATACLFFLTLIHRYDRYLLLSFHCMFLSTCHIASHWELIIEALVRKVCVAQSNKYQSSFFLYCGTKANTAEI